MKLTMENIDKSVKKADEFFKELEKDNENNLRMKLIIEEALLIYRDNFGEGCSFDVSYGKFLGTYKAVFSIEGPMLNSFGKEVESRFVHRLMDNSGFRVSWDYSKGSNVITFAQRKKEKSSWKAIVAAIILAVVLGYFSDYLPDNVQNTIIEGVLTPLLNCFLGVLTGVAGPMIFLSTILGIYSLGDVQMFAVIGKKLTVSLLAGLALITCIVFTILYPMYDLKTGGSAGGLDFSGVYEMLLNIMPENIFKPFTDGNTLQILVLGVIVATVMLVLDTKIKHLGDIVEEINAITQTTMQIVIAFLPIFVFGSLYKIIAGGSLSQLAICKGFVTGSCLACGANVILVLALVCIVVKISPIEIIKKTAKPVFVAFTTASSAASFSACIETCEKKFGIDRTLVSFGIPFSQIMFMPAQCLGLLAACLSVAEFNSMEIGVSWTIQMIVVCMLLSIALPPVPGGGTAMYSILFAQMNLPMETIAIIITIDVMLDFLFSAVTIFSDNCLVLYVASRLNLIDKNKRDVKEA